MKDLDFDELDRAVSSLLEPKSSSVLSETSSREETPSTSEHNDVEAQSSTTSVVPQKKSFIEKRSSGRFMDVVHSSSDMKNLQKPTISRQAPAIAVPTVSDPIESARVSADHIEAISETEEPIQTNEEVSFIEDEINAEDLHTLPDPLDFHNFNVEDQPVASSDETQTNVAESTVEEPATDTYSDEDKHDDEQELELERVASELSELDGLMQGGQEQLSVDTPFVSDPAIEKRPLGAFSVGPTDQSLLTVETVDSSAVEDEEIVSDKEDTVTSEQLSEKTQDTQTTPAADVVPEELREDIIAIESVDVSSASTPSSNPVAGSISQQYTEKNRPVSHEQTPVFDTAQYHQPLKHTVKKKSGWLTVLLIFVFVLIGVGGGAAMYYFDPFSLLQ